jgi:hypothetical protein
LPEGTEKKKENPWVAVAQPQIQVWVSSNNSRVGKMK